MALAKGQIPEASLEEDEEVAEAEEGRILTRIHRSRERSRQLVEQKKASVLKAHGSLRCEACAFDFELTYGERGKGFIEAHHVKPVHTLKPGERTRLEDLVLICSNCHRILHTRRPWLTMDELRQLVHS
jgi:5-methylcytosine-specific restriction protein A